jgi:outer membrane protein assembly factor BamA
MLRFVSFHEYFAFRKQRQKTVIYRGAINILPSFLILPEVTLQVFIHKAQQFASTCVAILIAAQLVPVSVARAQETPKPAAQKGTAAFGAPASMPPEMELALQAYDGQKVSSVELAGRTGPDDQDLTSLFEQHAGDPFDRDKVKRTIAAIKATGRFQDVQLDVIPDIEGVRVLLVLQPGLYFGIYEFPGSKNFPYSRLLQVANYPPEGPYNRSDVTQASEALTKFFQQNGYFLAKVAPQIDTDAAHGIVNVRFVVDQGRLARFGQVTLTGASEAQTAQLQAKLKSKLARLRSSAIRAGKPYSLKTIQNATLLMQSALVKQDHLGAQVQLIGAEYDPATNLAAINFHVADGPLVHVGVEGAHVWKATQRKLIPLYQQVGVDDELIEEGRRNLISHFQSKGYFDADVETSISKQGSGETILYKIEKGPKHKVSTVSIDGNKVLGDSQLLAHVSVKKAKLFSRGAYSEKLLRASTKNLEATYRAEGFSDVKVTPKVEGKGGNIDVTFLVNEGPRDTVRELKIVGNNTMPVTQLVPKGLKLAAGQPYSQKNADQDHRTITVKYLESGYLTASFRETVKSVPGDKHSLIVTYEIYEGPKVTTSSVITLGRDHTKQRFIDRAAKLTLQKPLTTGDMLSAESRLYSPGIFDWAEVSPRRRITTQTEEDVLVKVHEAKRSTLTYGFGFEVINRGGNLPSGTVAVPGLPPVGVNSNFQTSEKTFWGPRGSVEYTRRNILGMAESLTLASLAGRLVQRVTASFQNPSFRGTSFNSNLSASFEHNSENPIYTDKIEQIGFQLGKPLDHKKTQNLYLRYNFSETEISNLLIPELVPTSDLDVRLSTLSATYSRDTRDNTLDAKRGIYESLEVDFNPEVLGSSVSFVKMLGQVSHYKKLPSNVIWANSLRLGFDTAFAGSHVPLSQEFFSGGGSTLRGFALDEAGPQNVITACGIPGVASTCSPITVPEGGRQLLIVNSEFRVPLPIRKELGAVGFYDGGNVFRAIGFHGEYTNTIGGGLRYATPVGPIRFDLGYNLNAPRGLNALQYFITLGQAF